MKNSLKIYSLIALVGMALSFSSCTKCVTCKVTDQQGYVISDQEVCGNKDNQDQNKSYCESLAGNISGTCKCSTKFTL